MTSIWSRSLPSGNLHTTLRSHRLLLERLGPAHVGYLLETLKDRNFRHHFPVIQPYNLSRTRLLTRLEKERLNSTDQRDDLVWVIFKTTGNDKRPIGLACLIDYLPETKNAEMMIGIPRQADRVMGRALEASLLVMEFAFNLIGLNKLISHVYTDNKSAQANSIKLGFTQEGFLREHYFDPSDNCFLDVYRNGLLADEFRSSKRLSLLSCRLLQRDVTLAPDPIKNR
ncbi:MAG: GNAT family N-acetyltransferase [Pseudomonadales bacterium]|nr:GNAT family N-acetyltransferase [Pseudomonadales bacterium]